MTGSATPFYGFDGPDALAGIGATAVLSGTAAAVLLRRGHRVAGIGAGAVAAAAGTAATSMLAYSARGKTVLRERLLDAVAWRGDETVLDVGTGSGLMLVGAARRTTGTVLGVDIWRGRDLTGNGPGRAAENASLSGVAVRLVTGDAQRLPVRDGSVDVVVSVLCLHNLPDPDAACREIVRVLTPGGTAVIADYQGTAAYARSFAAAGLRVRTSRAPLLEVLGPMGVVVAHAS